MAERTGLEPATSGVTGRHSNQLNYRSSTWWWVLQGSNLRPTACRAVALPTELNTPIGKPHLTPAMGGPPDRTDSPPQPRSIPGGLSLAGTA